MVNRTGPALNLILLHMQTDSLRIALQGLVDYQYCNSKKLQEMNEQKKYSAAIWGWQLKH